MSSNLKILFVGSNPSEKAGSNDAFTADTSSGRILRGWIEGIQGTIILENIVSQKTENNRPLKKNEMAQASASLLERIKGINPDRLVALGKSAATVLTSLGLKHLEMPHPSGLNRKLNDRQYTEAAITALKNYCKQ